MLHLYCDMRQARELGRVQKKWLLVNIQQVDAFESLRLNRDVWKAEVVQVRNESAG